MRAILRIAATTTAAGLLVASAATMASASTASPHPAATHAARVHLTSGETSLTTVSGLAAELLGDGIVALATTPGTQTLVGTSSDPQFKFSFPVTGGRVNPARLTGTIRHRGGILFVNTAMSSETIKLSRFRISLTSKRLSAIVTTAGPGTRVTVATLNFSHARFSVGLSHVKVRKIGVHLTTPGATALDSALGTSVFVGGMKIAEMRTLVRF